MGKLPHTLVSATSLPAMVIHGRKYKEADHFNRKVLLFFWSQEKDHCCLYTSSHSQTVPLKTNNNKKTQKDKYPQKTKQNKRPQQKTDKQSLEVDSELRLNCSSKFCSMHINSSLHIFLFLLWYLYIVPIKSISISNK